MIAHVAEAGESRGRVVLRLTAGRPSACAIEAALLVAQAWNSELEGLAVEDTNLIQMASFPFAREQATTGRWSRALDSGSIERELRHALKSAFRQVEALARIAQVPLHYRTVRDEPVRALAGVCADNGPWNVVALAEPFDAMSSDQIRSLLDGVVDATALVLVGPKVQRFHGRIVVALEDGEHLSSMLRAAERLAAVHEDPVALLLVADRDEDLAQLEGEVRLALQHRPEVAIRLAGVSYGEASVAAEAIRKLGAGFLVARFGGLVVPSDGRLRPLAASLECPMLLVR